MNFWIPAFAGMTSVVERLSSVIPAEAGIQRSLHKIWIRRAFSKLNYFQMNNDFQIINDRLKKVERLLPRAMLKDRHIAARELQQIRSRIGRFSTPVPDEKKWMDRLAAIEKKLRVSGDRKRARIASRPKITCDENLPIVVRRQDIVEAIKNHSVIIVSGETGSGKTTQLPKFCIEAGRGVDGLIGCTQPRRIAAMTVAQRIADELNEPLGRSVGYKIRFADRTSRENAWIKLMTDGILLAEAQTDRYLNAYDTLIIDEAHERSLNIDFILGILRNLLARRKDLKLIITSATIDTEKFSKAFDNAPIIEVSGRMYPVEVRYRPAGAPDKAGEGSDDDADADDQSLADRAVAAVDGIAGPGLAGDILVFMPTENDIRETCETLEGRKYRHTTVLSLYARLSAADQMRVFAPVPGRKIVVATNIAETSITVPGIRYVVDTGLARISSYHSRTRTMSLPVVPVSKSSADQRKGRCGRVQNGICIRLYSEEDYLGRSLFTPPEILRADLAEVILRMIALNLGDMTDFPFVDPPPSRQIRDGVDLLTELGAIVPNPHSGKPDAEKLGSVKPAAGAHVLTDHGRLMVRIPLEPRLSKMLISAWERGCIREVMVIVAALTIPDPREKPKEFFAKAEAAHQKFNDPASDFITLYNIWRACFGETGEAKAFVRSRDLKKFCAAHFMSFKRMREWRDVHEQIVDILEESGFDLAAAPEVKASKKPDELFSDRYIAIHQSVLSGFLSNIAVKKEKNLYQATRQRQAMIFPGSGLFNKGGQWIVAAEMVETSRLFARRVASIRGDWLEPLGGILCKYTYSNARWEKKREAVVADEQVSLYGLVIVSNRVVNFGPKNPEAASAIFTQSALVQGDVKTVLPFMTHNWSLIEEVKDIENRVRRRDLLVSEAALAQFYQEKLSGGPPVYDMPTLKKWLREKGSDEFLKMRLADIMATDPDADQLSRFPDQIPVGEALCDLEYQFEPGRDHDGVTVKIPLSAASAAPLESTDWVVPGLLAEKITELIRALPKSLRKQLVPVAETVAVILTEMPRNKGSLANSLSRFLYDRFKVDIPASLWNEDALPDHLKMRITLTDASGKEIRTSRDKGVLLQSLSRTPALEGFDAQRKHWEKTGLTGWNFEDLPEVVEITNKNGHTASAYPGLAAAADATVNLCLFASRQAADESHRQEVRALYARYFAKDIQFLKKNLTLTAGDAALARYFGGQKQVEQKLLDRVLSDLFGRDFRTRTEFSDYAAQQVNQLLPAGQALLSEVLPVMTAYHAARTLFYTLETTRPDPVILAFVEELRNALTGLAPENFITLYERERMPHLVRYINALIRRTERGRADLDKDRKKAAELKPFAESLKDMIEGLTPAASAEKRSAVEAYYWMIEEFKVSLFAQELKTAYPVSVKKLNEEIHRISRMV
ncbi:MAG: ATP-dependent RNA helicase HrpA [Desulfobacterales bacterium CG23_combo_of_CG06-09_8_20_14_all_51_8]|nr:MAG: ATP-dependent RNA helicase HrpA [Desulfobacterales bacterium CG23_combo_of_CG06-09_8_20_14_all_51_8]